MKRLFIVLMFSTLLLGCVAERQENVPLVTSTPTANGEVFTAPTLSITASPATTVTPKPSITPSLIPTKISTPTSNFQNIPQVIFSPAPRAICPSRVNSQIPIPTTFPSDDKEFEQVVINILNSGGVDQLVRYLSVLPNFSDSDFRYDDLTNDGVRELIIRNKDAYRNLTVFGCQNGKYINFLSVRPSFEQAPKITTVQDMNHDGVKELVVDIETCHYCTAIMVYEWNGSGFDSLVRAWEIGYKSGKLEYSDLAELDGITAASVADIDKNGTFELLLDGGIPSYVGGMIGVDGPWRQEKVIYMWNGENFVWYSQKYDPPNFRFEAIQDGDTETIRGDYDSAVKSYQAAIFDEKLKSWTQEVWRDISQNQDPENLRYPDVEKMPFNQKEYDQLSAYARYRIMIIYLKQGWESDAETVYQTLIETYTQGRLGYPYSELANEFWNEFQISHDLILSCNQAITYATKYPEILEPLGSHGLFDKYYEPEDICPFR